MQYYYYQEKCTHNSVWVDVTTGSLTDWLTDWWTGFYILFIIIIIIFRLFLFSIYLKL